MWKREPCAVCCEKDRRIGDLQDQIAMLREMVSPTLVKAPMSVQVKELDPVLSGNVDPPRSDLDNLNQQAAALLTGMYQSDQVEVS